MDAPKVSYTNDFDWPPLAFSMAPHGLDTHMQTNAAISYVKVRVENTEHLKRDIEGFLLGSLTEIQTEAFLLIFTSYTSSTFLFRKV